MESSRWTEPKGVDLGILSPVLGLLGVCGLLFTTNPIETLWSVVLFWLILKWFWWQNFPPIAVFLLLLPWLEVHTALFQANLNGQSLNQLYAETGKQTFWMASIGLTSVILGLKVFEFAFRKRTILSMDELKKQANSIDQIRLFIVWGVSNGFAIGLKSLIGYGSSLYQLTTYATGITEVIGFSVYLHFFLTRQRPWLFICFFTFNLISSFYSYFGSWQGPLIFLFLASLMPVMAIRTKEFLKYLPLVVATGALVFTWQSIKGDYREFLDQRQGGQDRYASQTIKVSREQALRRFTELVSNVSRQSEEERQTVIKATLSRIGYLQFFSATVGNVPENIPHESGNLIKENLTFSLIPRILNPNKGVKNDRLRTEKYSGIYLGGTRATSSFSLSHYCEAYIDWGPYRMMIQLFLYGAFIAVFWSLVIRFSSSLNALLFLGVLFVVLQPMGTMQKDMTEISGVTVWGAVSHLFIFSRFYQFFDRYVTKQ